MARRWTFAWVLTLLIAGQPAQGQSAPPPVLVEKPYQAEARLGIGRPGKSEAELLHGGMQSVVKFYCDGALTRIQVYEDTASIAANQGLGSSATCEITDEDIGRKYIFVLADRKARVFPLDAQAVDPIVELARFARGQPVFVSVEKTDGVLCNKFRSTFRNGRTAFVWVNIATGLPVKLGDGTSFVLVFTTFTYGPQDKALFVPPAG